MQAAQATFFFNYFYRYKLGVIENWKGVLQSTGRGLRELYEIIQKIKLILIKSGFMKL